MKSEMGIAGIIVRSGLTITKTILTFVIFGTLISWILLFFLRNELLSGFKGPAEALPVILGVLVFIREIIVIALFLLGFPFLYFFFGQKQGIGKVTFNFLSTQQKNFIPFLIEKLFNYLESKKIDINGKISNKKEILITEINNFLKKPNNVPYIIKKIIGFIVKRFGFLETIEGIIQDEKGDITKEKLIAGINKTFSEKITERFKPFKYWFWLVLLVEIVIFVVCKYWFLG